MKSHTLFALALVAVTFGAVSSISHATGVTVHETKNWKFNIDIDKDAVIEAAKVVGSKIKGAWNSVFSDHPSEQYVYETPQGKVLVVPLNERAGGSRLTNNANTLLAWTGPVNVRVFVANVPLGSDPSAMRFQQKYDEKWGSDPNIGPVMKHGDVIENFSSGNRRYFAHRGGPKYWGAYLVFVETTVSEAEMANLPGIRIR